jgi:SnoaL-like protein
MPAAAHDPVTVANAFRDAFERRDEDALAALLAPGVVLHSPVLGRPWEGRETVASLVLTMAGILGQVGFDEPLAGGRRAGLALAGDHAGRPFEAMLVLGIDERGAVATLTAMLRPLGVLQRLAKRMAAAVDPELLAAHGAG